MRTRLVFAWTVTNIVIQEVTEEFSGDTSSDNELLLAPSSPLVQPARVETVCDAPLLTVSTQEEELFLQSVLERVNCSFPELFSLALALGRAPSAASCTCSDK